VGNGAPVVSVVVPTHNRGELLRESVECMLAQDYPSFEAVYVNDGATDETAVLLDEYAAAHPERLRVLHIDNSGPGPARNAGVRLARGELLLFTDDDVLTPPDWITGMAAVYRMRGSDALCGGVDAVSTVGRVERYLHLRNRARFGDHAKPVKAAPMMNFMVSRKAFEETGGFLDEPLSAAEDWEFCLRFRRQGRTVFYDPAVKVRHRYQEHWDAAVRRMRDAGRLGAYIWWRQGGHVMAYTVYATLRFATCPFWAPLRYPIELWSTAWYMEAAFWYARLRAYFRSFRQPWQAIRDAP
jgi:glycosyltransferase involved in cell wall biosynthesis